MQILDQVTLSQSYPDSIIWPLQKTGRFSVKSVCLELAKTDSRRPIDLIAGVWRGLVPHRIKNFVWLALTRKVNSKEKLAKLGFIPTSDSICVLCNLSVECSDHLFLSCRIAWSLWCWWLNLWEISWAPPSSLRASFDQWLWLRYGAFFKKVWAASFFVIVWTIWKERNTRVFENKTSYVPQLQNLVLLRLSWLIKGWNDQFPYNAEEVLQIPAPSTGLPTSL
ncbi:uncharacterized protein [Spinacia oleracea]|uniref:Reverse transcriptase zinc-binding domain-containing protein n=1 Tax=Spinacia oleracea TaxID=3562 RepID=A0ABM3QYE2_SPIOL|nr:uncharacterized protein LOC130463307 [Spinacia oleracea]